MKKILAGFALLLSCVVNAAPFTVNHLIDTVPNPSINYQSASTGSVSRGYQSKLGDTVSILDFAGCDPTGVADSTACIQAALAVPSKNVYAPPGTYKVSGTIPLAYATSLYGAGRLATIFNVTSTNLPVFQASSFSTISGLQITSPASTQVSGSIFVTLSGSNSRLSGFYITNDYVGVLMVGSVSKITDGRMTGLQAGGIHIRAEGGDNSQLIDGVLGGAESSPNIGTAGIRVRNSSALTITNTSMIQEGVGLLIDPYTATTGIATDAGSVFSLNVSDSFFDNSNPNGIRISPTGTASVVRVRFDKVWTGSSGADGTLINNTGTGTVAGIYLSNHHSFLNTGAGISTNGTVSDIKVIGGGFSQNAYGIYGASGLTKLVVNGATIGAGSGLTGNSQYGIALASGASDFNITGNLIEGNTVGPVADSTGAVAKIFNGNTGYLSDISGTTLTVTGAVSGAKSVAAVATVGNGTLTAAQMLTGNIRRSGSTAGYADTTDTAANIIASIPNAAAGVGYELTIANTVGFIDTIAAGAGVTLSGTTAIAASASRKYVVTITNVSAPAVTITGVASGGL
jgi:hypothetical protein